MQEKELIEKSDISRFMCENCGANMGFDAAAGGLLCSYCGHNKAVVVSGTVDEQSFADAMNDGTHELQRIAVNAMESRCDSCGAIVEFTPPETSTVCVFCGAKIVAQPKAADPRIAPNGVLPFSVPNNVAMTAFNEWLASLWFAPSKLSQMAKADKLDSIYIPYWTYDSFSQSYYEGERGENYTDWETYTDNGQTKQRSVTKTRWYSASGNVSRHFDDVCVPATGSLPIEYLNKLEPWDLDKLVPYEPAYLSGHKAQAYQVVLPEGFERFKQIAARVIDRDCRQDIGGDHQRLHDVKTNFSEITFKHLLLPIYAGAYHFNGKVYQIVVNGRTGEVQGGRPYSWAKIGALVFTILILLLLALAVFR